MNTYDDVIKKDSSIVGTDRQCNVCGYRFKKFYFYNKINPRESLCPVCGSLERHRHLYIYLLAMYPFLKNKKILHFAPENIIKEKLIESQADYYDADIDKDKATYQMDITDIKFEKNYFDYIICVHVLEHIVDDVKAMGELYRVLNRNGIALIATPFRAVAAEDNSIISPQERAKFFGQEDHVRVYSLALLCERLNSVGFDTSLIADPNCFPDKFKVESKLSQQYIFARKL